MLGMNSNEATPVPTHLARNTRLLYKQGHKQRRPKSDLAITKVMRIFGHPNSESPTGDFSGSQQPRHSALSQTPNCEHTPVYFGRDRGIAPEFVSKSRSPQNLDYEEFAQSKSTLGFNRASNDQVVRSSDTKSSIPKLRLPLQPTPAKHSAIPTTVQPVEEAQIEAERFTLQQSNLNTLESTTRESDRLEMERLRAKRAIAKRIQGQRTAIKQFEETNNVSSAAYQLELTLSVDIDISDFVTATNPSCTIPAPFVRPNRFPKVLRLVVSSIALASYVALNLSFT